MTRAYLIILKRPNQNHSPADFSSNQPAFFISMLGNSQNDIEPAYLSQLHLFNANFSIVPRHSLINFIHSLSGRQSLAIRFKSCSCNGLPSKSSADSCCCPLASNCTRSSDSPLRAPKRPGCPPCQCLRLDSPIARLRDLQEPTKMCVGKFVSCGRLTLAGTDSLKPPASNTFLQVLAIGKGIFNYTCAGVPPESPPEFDAQYTELYDAAPLISVLPDEETFHSLVPMILGYDYERMENSTMTCMGSIGTLNATAVITLYDIDTFEVSRSETVLAPENPDKNAMWSHTWSANNTWDIYRVETYGGRPPPLCKGQPDVIEIEYAAEYWFYRHDE